jgi:hypothetical protein
METSNLKEKVGQTWQRIELMHCKKESLLKEEQKPLKHLHHQKVAKVIFP